MAARHAPIEVVLIDDHTLFREGVRALLEPVADIVVVAEAADLAGLEALGSEADVAVTDLRLPDGTDAAVLAAVRRHLPRARVLVLAAVDDLDTVESVLRAGAGGFVGKDVTATELIDAIRAIATYGTYLRPSLVVALARHRHEREDDLSDRQRDVVRLVALGHTNAEIADLVGVSLRTIETTRATVGRKLGAGSRTQLVRYALEHGLVREVEQD